VDVGAFEAGAVLPPQSISFGVLPRQAAPAIFSGAIGELTSATTNEKLYSTVNPFGAVRFQNVAADFYILQLRGKRAGVPSGPIPLELDSIPTGPPADEFNATENLSGFRFIIDRSK
jgi:hypothetical protein